MYFRGMKATGFTFLIFLAILLGNCGYSSAQDNSMDSLNYYSSSARNPKNETDLEKAYTFFLNYHERAKKKSDTLAMAYGLQSISSIEYKAGLYVESENSAVQALSLLDQIKSSSYVNTLKISLYNHLGLVYQGLQFYDKAGELYKLSLSLTQSANDSLILFNNLGYSLLEVDDFKSAEPYLLSAEELMPKVKDSIQIARVWANLGFVKHKLNRDEGVSLILKGLSTRKNASDLAGLYSNYKILASYYSDKQKLNISNRYLDSAYTVARRLKSLSFEKDVLKAMALQNSSFDMKTYFAIADSLKKLNNENQNKFALIKYDFEKLNQTVLENKILAQKERSKSIILGFTMVFLVIIGLGLAFWIQARNKKKRLQDIYATESRISKKVHDEVANDVYHVMAKLQQKIPHNEDILDDLDDIYSKTREISKDNSVVYTKDFQTTLRDLLMSFQSNNVNVIIKGLSGVNWENLKDLERTTIYKVLQELMVNMRKHSEANLVGLTFEQTGRKLHIGYTDNGKGCQLKKQLGLQNTENRIRAIGGSIIFDSQPQMGFKSIIIL